MLITFSLFSVCARSLMKPQKYTARRRSKESSQQISTITSDRDGRENGPGPARLGGPPGGIGGPQQQQQALQQQQQQQLHAGGTQPLPYDRSMTQVQTYTDHGNSYVQRSSGTTHYSKVCCLSASESRLASVGSSSCDLRVSLESFGFGVRIIDEEM